MAFDFPNSPTPGQIVTGPGGIQWQWDGVKWTVINSASPGVAPINNPIFTGEFWLSDQGTYASRSGGIGVQSGTVQFWGMQLEIGPTATPLEKLVPEVDLARCQRFYHTGIFQVWGYANSGQPFGQTLTFPAAMRAAPTITFTAPAYQNGSNLAVNISGASQASVSTLATATGNNSVYSPYTASADL